jgi:hypothetical protein
MNVPVTLDADKGTLLAVGIVGSTAYGMATASSDVDRMGLYASPTTAWFGLSVPADERGTIVKHDGPEGDVQLHEARKYARLALSGNPTAVELMWLPEDCYEVVSEEFRMLQDIRHRLLSRKRIRDAYYGYARDQLNRLVAKGRFAGSDEQRREKHARHIRRLLDQGLHAYRTGEIRIRVDDPERYHAFGRACRDSAEPAVAALAEASEEFDSIDSPLQEHPDRQALDDWLVFVRWKHLHGA